jgi:hypothetical protein
MKVGHDLGFMTEFGRKDPLCFFISTFITSPADKVYQVAGSMTPVSLGIKNFGDLVLGFTVNFNWLRRGLGPLQNGVWDRRLDHRDMEDQVDCTHAVRKSQSVRPEAHLGDSLKGTEIFLSQFLQGRSGPEELCFDKRIGSDSKFRGWSPMSIGQDLVPRLSGFDLLFQGSLDLINVEGEVSCLRGC